MRIGPYEVVRELGRGGMGVVVLAKAPDGREVAIKTMLGRPAGPSVDRFSRERRLLETLGREVGFVPLLDAGTSADGPYIVMPFLTGGTLRARLDGSPMALETALPLARALAAALARAHGHGIVHRDLKPENVLFDGDGTPLVADLGLAKHFSTSVSGASQSVVLSVVGQLRGTFGYMPREQARDAMSAGPQADVFALGAIVYECLAGSPAFRGHSAMEVLGKVERGDYDPLELVRPDVPEWLAEVVRRTLALEPEDRFADADELATALVDEGRARSASGVRSPGRPAQRSPRLGRLVVGALGVAGVASLAGTVASIRRSDRREAREFLAAAAAEDDPRRALAVAETLSSRVRGLEEVSSFLARARTRVAALETLESVPPLVPAADRVAAASAALALDDRCVPGLLVRAAADIELARAQFSPGTPLGVAGSRRAALEQSARLDLDKAVALAPTSVAVHWRRARLLEHMQVDVGEPLRSFRSAASLDPLGPFGAMAEALIAERTDPDRALAMADAAVSRAPRSGEARLVRLRARVAKRSVIGIEDDALQAIALDRSLAGDAHGVLAFWFACVRHDRHAAMVESERAIRDDPGSAVALAVRAFAQEDGGRVTDAEDTLHRFRDQSASHALADAVEAWLDLRHGRAADALDAAARALAKDAGMVPALLAQAQALLEREPERARPVADRAVALDEGWTRASLVRSRIALRMSDLETARAHAERALHLDESSADAWAQLAAVCVEQPPGESLPTFGGAPQPPNGVRAYEATTRALELDPELPLPWIVRARLSLRQGKSSYAATEAREALKRRPPHEHEVWVLLGDALVAERDVDGARAAYEKAVGLAPEGSPGRESARSKLVGLVRGLR